ncbi:MAG: rRNA pseudouridine synthase [Clostridia bacterium]|nr:rRNA pseudouridine synthase [Clostridia bacterium]
MRLQKYMADCGIASRRKCEEYIEQGLVTVNGEVALLGMSIDPDTDRVEYDGEVLKKDRNSEKVVIMLNKPRGVVSSCSDPQGRRTTADYFRDLPYRLYNVGRLDIDTEGLLLFTNDGDFAYKVMHPSFEIHKTYRALIDGELTHEQAERLRHGVMLDDGMTSPAAVEGISVGENDTSFYIRIHEGRNRQVRRMIDAIGHKTLRLRRVAVGQLKLYGLHTGEWRFLTREEIDGILNGK